MSNDFDDDDENFEADDYELGSSDLTVVNAAIQLLKKIILAPFVSPAEIVSVSKAMHVLKRLPHPSSEMNVSITLTGPRRSFHGREEKHEIYHWWEVEIEETLITITSRGYFYRKSTGGDSFIAMDWKAAPACETDHADFLDQLGLVDDAQPFEQEVMQIDLSKPGYKLTVNDDDNPLLDEIAEDEESDLTESSLDEDEDAGMTTGVHEEKVTKAHASGFALTDEMLRAIGGRVFGTIRAGVKSFEVMIKEMRANFAKEVPANVADEILRAVKPNLINSWNSMKDKYDLNEATDANFDDAMSDVDIEQAAKSATTVTCKQCGTQNRVGEVPLGRKAVCCSCRSVLGSMESPCPPKRSAKLSIAWAWIAILGIGLVAWIADSSHSGRRKESTNSSALQSQPSKSYSPDYSSSSSRQILPTPWKPAFTEPEQVLPPHGKITWYSNGDPIAPLEIRSSIGSHYVVKVSDYDSERDVLSVFVHGGSTINLDVPLGTYCIKYASGDHWYGSTHLFGPETAYYKADSSFDFRVTGNQVSGYTLTLYKVEDGNLQTTPISPNEF